MIRRLLSRLIHAIHATCPPRLPCCQDHCPDDHARTRLIKEH